MTDSYTLIKNAKAIVSCDANDTVYNNCDILISGPEIKKIAKSITCDNANVIDGSDKFVYPGLINTHHHFFQTFVRNTIHIDYPGMTVIQWLREIYKVFEQINSDVIYYSSLTAMADLIKHGCTCAFDHQYCYTKNTGLDPIDRQFQAAQLLNMRYHAGRGTNTLPQSEGSTIPEGMIETTDTFINDCTRLIKTYHDPTPFSMRQIVIAPCQPVNCYKDTFVQSASLAKEYNLKLHTHLGEGENEIMFSRWGMRTVEYCDLIGFLTDNTWLAHSWETNDQENVLLSKRGTGVSHCPLPAVLGGFPILNLNKLNSQNVLVSLGCDGSATNDGSNLLESLRIAYLMQTYYSKQRHSIFTPYEVLKLATVNGAKTLGRNDLGSLEVGKAADLFMLDVSKIEFAGTLHDPKQLIAKIGACGPVYLTMINGKVVWEKGSFAFVDEAKLTHKAEDVCQKVLRDKFPKQFAM